tara:strand:+ start:4237 stop:4617 length:381 start_codon:yes stop_codon:yes gene_type:complete
MIGLTDYNGKVATCAYTIASLRWKDHLESYSIIVPESPPPMQLWHIQIGDDIILRPKTTDTFGLARLRDEKYTYWQTAPDLRRLPRPSVTRKTMSGLNRLYLFTGAARLPSLIIVKRLLPTAVPIR